jgi:allantoin racemase
MRILIINPNTSVEMSETIDVTAKKFASNTTEITTVNPKDGPTLITNAYDLTLQATRVIDLVERNKASYDCFIIACGGDPGLEACRTITKNVLGIGETAFMTACAVAKSFSLLSTTKGAAASMPERLRSLGIDQSRCASVRVVGSGTSDEIVRKRQKMFNVYCQVGQQCVNEDGADALILSCAGMSDLGERLGKFLKTPVIIGVVSAVRIAEQLP